MDFSLTSALELGKIDTEFGLTSTFFVRFRAETYNLFEPTSVEQVSRLIELGHKIGLHFEPSPQDLLSVKSLEISLTNAAKILEQSGLLSKVEVFSFHQTTPAALEYREREYAGLINAYSSNFLSYERYCSDSGGFWKYRPLSEFLMDPEIDRAQVLTHPEWWLNKDLPPFQKIHLAAVDSATNAINRYEMLLNSFDLPLHKGLIENIEIPESEFENQYGSALNYLWHHSEYDASLAILLSHEDNLQAIELTGFITQFQSSVSGQIFLEAQNILNQNLSASQLLEASFSLRDEVKQVLILALRARKIL